RAHVHRKPVDAIVKPRPDADQLRTRMHRDGDSPLPLAQGQLQSLQHREVAPQGAEFPLAVQRLEQSLQITGRVMHVGLAHLDVMKMHDRIEGDGARVRGLAHHLAVDLAAGRHVDDEVALDVRRAGQPVTRWQRAATREALLGGAYRGEIGGLRADAVLREVTLHHQHLATPAQRAPAAHRVDVDSQAAGGLQERCAQGEAAALAGRREDHPCAGLTRAHVLCVRLAHEGLWARLRCPPSRRPRAAPSGVAAAAAPEACSAGASRKRRIQRAQSGSWPIMTSAAMHALTISRCIGFMIAEVSPAPIAMVRKVALMPSRAGRPKLTLDAPQVVFTRSSFLRRRSRCMTCTPAWLMAPIGMTSGSTTMSLAGMP